MRIVYVSDDGHRRKRKIDQCRLSRPAFDRRRVDAYYEIFLPRLRSHTIYCQIYNNILLTAVGPDEKDREIRLLCYIPFAVQTSTNDTRSYRLQYRSIFWFIASKWWSDFKRSITYNSSSSSVYKEYTYIFYSSPLFPFLHHTCHLLHIAGKSLHYDRMFSLGWKVQEIWHLLNEGRPTLQCP